MSGGGEVSIKTGLDHLAWRWRLGLGLYVAVAGASAAWGDTRSTGFLLAGAVLTMPVGLAAVVGVYAIYGLVVGLGRGLGARVMEGNGWNPLWFVVLDEVLVTVLFVAAAVANSFLILGMLSRRRREG